MKSRSYDEPFEIVVERQDFYLSIPADKWDNFPDCGSCSYCVRSDVRQALCLLLSKQSTPQQKHVIFFVTILHQIFQHYLKRILGRDPQAGPAGVG